MLASQAPGGDRDTFDAAIRFVMGVLREHGLWRDARYALFADDRFGPWLSFWGDDADIVARIILREAQDRLSIEPHIGVRLNGVLLKRSRSNP